MKKKYFILYTYMIHIKGVLGVVKGNVIYKQDSLIIEIDPAFSIIDVESIKRDIKWETKRNVTLINSINQL